MYRIELMQNATLKISISCKCGLTAKLAAPPAATPTHVDRLHQNIDKSISRKGSGAHR